MRKTILILLLPLALSLGACASLGSIGESVLKLPAGVLTESTQNPVTPTMLYQVENGLTLAISAALSYKRLCAAKQIDQSCREVVRKMQGYTRQAKPILRELRAFVRNNDQVNAQVAFASIRSLLVQFQAAQASAPNTAGVK